MQSDDELRVFDDGVLLTIDASEAEETGSRTPLLEECAEQRLAGERDPARHAVVREALDRLRSRKSSPEKNVEDHDLIVGYLLYGRLK